MNEKKKTKTINEAVSLGQELENVDTRSVFGDNHAAKEDDTLAAHAKQLLERNIIDGVQAEELSRPRRNRGEHFSSYTAEYLAMHPLYMGQNHDPMPNLDKARDHRKARDKKMLKLLRDFEEGRVDVNGMPVLSLANASHSTLKAVQDMTESRPLCMEDDSSHQKCHSATTSESSRSSTESSPARKLRVEPLKPSPGLATYVGSDYYELVALCRQRKLKRGGCLQEVRNRLIRDDKNIAEGTPREQVRKSHVRRFYKHTASTETLTDIKAEEDGQSMAKSFDATGRR